MSDALNKRRWIKQEGKGDNLTKKILDIKGIKNKDLFLNGKLSDMHDIALLNDGIKAGNIIKEAIKNGEKIIIYTDYDTDGASGGAVSYMMLTELGADVNYYANNRFKQGYGICVSGIDEIIEMYSSVGLIITVDNGIVAFEQAKYLKEKGIKLVITDHHDQGEGIPDAEAVVNPKRKDSTYPFNGICGATVVWKVIRELYKDKKDANKYLDILAISTVGDVVPLVDENRIIVKEGLKLLNNDSRKSLKILRELTNTAEINSHFTLGFIYSPIFNAISRLKGEIIPVIDMLVSEDEDFIRKTAAELIDINNKRKDITNTQLERAKEKLVGEEIKKVIVLYDEDFSEGIVGLIAGRLKEEYNRPVIALTKSDDGKFIKGSARSIEGYNVKECFDKCKDLLLGYGGHAMAGGLSLKEENLEKLEERLIKLANELLTTEDYIKKFYYVDILKEDEINMDLIDELKELEPYGKDFEKPLIMIKDFNVRRVFAMGKEKNHIKLVGDDLSLIAWRQVEHYEKRGKPLNITALGYPEINVYRNNVNMQFMIDNDNFM